MLQGVADSESRFIFVDRGASGKRSDGGTFSASSLCHFLEDVVSASPKPVSFEGSGTEMSFVILGDEACPLKTYLMKPFARKDLSYEERVFNVGILTAKWRLLNKTIETKVNKAARIVRCISFLQK